MKKWILLAMALGLTASGCTTARPAKERAPQLAATTIPQTIRPQQASDAGLWRGGAKIWLFRDLRARDKGDVVTVNIVETAKANKQAATKTGRDSSIDAGISNFLGYENWVKDRLNEAYGFDNEHLFRANISKNFDGSGSTSRNETMTAAISARVVEVLPNGNLVIRGSRHVRVNHEDQIIVLSGIIRPEDISPDNTILSSFVADARIEYFGKGVVSDEQRPGWLARILDAVWPF